MLFGPSYAKWHPKNYDRDCDWKGGTATHSMQMLAKQIFNHLFFFGRSSPGRISWPAGWQSDSLARIVSPLPNWLPASLCRFQQAKHVPASNLSFVFSFRLLFSSEQVDDGLVSTGREQPLFFCWSEPTTWSGHIFIICIIICVIYGFKTEYLMRLVPWVSRVTPSPLFDWLVRRILEVRLAGLIGWI